MLTQSEDLPQLPRCWQRRRHGADTHCHQCGRSQHCQQRLDTASSSWRPAAREALMTAQGAADRLACSADQQCCRVAAGPPRTSEMRSSSTSAAKKRRQMRSFSGLDPVQAALRSRLPRNPRSTFASSRTCASSPWGGKAQLSAVVRVQAEQLSLLCLPVTFPGAVPLRMTCKHFHSTSQQQLARGTQL